MTRRRLRFQDRLLLLVLATALPAWLAAGILLWRAEGPAELRGAHGQRPQGV